MKTAHIVPSILALIVAIGCQEVVRDAPTPELVSAPTGVVAWLDSENPSTWTGSKSPYFLYLYSRRSVWSWDMAEEVFGDAELAKEIGRISRTVAIDVDLRPDLLDRFGTGTLPGVAVLTPDLDWITGAGWMGHEDVTDLARLIRILNDIPERMVDLERERGRLLKRHPYRHGDFARTDPLPKVLAKLLRLAGEVEAPSRSGEMQLLLSERAGIKITDWLDSVTATAVKRPDGLYGWAIQEDSRIQDQAHLIEANLGWLYVLGHAGRVDKASDLAEDVLAYLPIKRGLLTSGFADFTLDSNRVVDSGTNGILLDGRAITAWNAMFVSGASITQTEDGEGLPVAGGILDTLMSRRIRQNGAIRVEGDHHTQQLEDVTHLVRAALDYAVASGDRSYQRRAETLVQDLLDGGFAGTLSTAPNAPNQPVGADNHYGSASGVLAQNLVRLYQQTGQMEYRDMAETLCREAIYWNFERVGRLGAVGRALAELVALEGEPN